VRRPIRHINVHTSYDEEVIANPRLPIHRHPNRMLHNHRLPKSYLCSAWKNQKMCRGIETGMVPQLIA
jgi:hypothetical protein